MPDGNNIIMTVHCAGTGWCGIGLSPNLRMSGSDYYIGWKNSTGGTTLSRRSTTGHLMPSYAQNQIASLVPLNVTAPSWANIAFSFKRPIAADTSFTASSRFIYGYSDSTPSSIDDPQSSFPKHRSYGTLPAANLLAVNAAAGNGSTNVAIGAPPAEPIVSSTPEQYRTVVAAHGILFFIAWACAPFLGVFIARYLKDRLGHWWYRLHLTIMLGVTGLFSLISFILIILFKRPEHFDSIHSQIGIAVIAITIGQIVSGFVSNALWTPDRESIPWWDQAHWWVGRSVMVLGIVNVYLGLAEYKEIGQTNDITGLTIGYWIWIAIAFVVMLVGEIRIGVVHHLKSGSSQNHA